MTHEPGDIVLVPFPYSNLKSRKRRPALVVSKAVNAGRDHVLCAMTSNLDNAEHSVLVENKDLSDGRLLLTSRIKVCKMSTIDDGVVIKRLGAVKQRVLEQVRNELRAFLLL